MNHYKLFRNTVLCIREQPVLMTADGIVGPYSPNDRLPGCDDNAYAIVFRALAGEPKPNDPRILVEDGAADPTEYMWSWLGIRQDEIEKAKLIVKILGKIEHAKAKVA